MSDSFGGGAIYAGIPFTRTLSVNTSIVELTNGTVVTGNEGAGIAILGRLPPSLAALVEREAGNTRAGATPANNTPFLHTARIAPPRARGRGGRRGPRKPWWGSFGLTEQCSGNFTQAIQHFHGRISHQFQTDSEH